MDKWSIKFIQRRDRHGLEGPHKAKLNYATKLTFQAMNNVAEYEAILMTLQIIKKARA